MTKKLQLSRKLLWLEPYCSTPEVHQISSKAGSGINILYLLTGPISRTCFMSRADALHHRHFADILIFHPTDSTGLGAGWLEYRGGNPAEDGHPSWSGVDSRRRRLRPTRYHYATQRPATTTTVKSVRLELHWFDLQWICCGFENRTNGVWASKSVREVGTRLATASLEMLRTQDVWTTDDNRLLWRRDKSLFGLTKKQDSTYSLSSASLEDFATTVAWTDNPEGGFGMIG